MTKRTAVADDFYNFTAGELEMMNLSPRMMQRLENEMDVDKAIDRGNRESAARNAFKRGEG